MGLDTAFGSKLRCLVTRGQSWPCDSHRQTGACPCCLEDPAFVMSAHPGAESLVANASDQWSKSRCHLPYSRTKLRQRPTFVFPEARVV